VLPLGAHFSVAKEDWQELANRIEELISGQETLCPLSAELEAIAARHSKAIIRKNKQTGIDNSKALVVAQKPESGQAHQYEKVDINSVKNSDICTVGGEHVAYETIKELKLDKQLGELGFNRVEIAAALGMIVGRMLYPGSERRTHHWLQEKSALGELIDYNFHKLSLSRAYSASDRLLAKKSELEEFLYEQEKSLFNFNEAVVLYDLTNTYFEGTCKSNKKAAFGRSKEKRSDCRLVTLGLVLNKEGFPRRTEILPGNVAETKTMEAALEQLSGRVDGGTKPTVIMDAGISTEENLAYLSREGYTYIVVSRKRNPIMPEGECCLVKEKGGNTVKVKLVKNTETNESELYCHSTGKEQKELAMKSAGCQHYEEGLTALAEGLHKKGCTKKYEKVLLAIGRLNEKYKRVSGRYEVEVTQNEEKLATTITWKQKVEENSSAGVYCLRTNTDLSEAELWKTYMMLTEVESVFRCLKSELGMRPVYHQKTERVDGHLFISVLAYHVIQTIMYKLKQHKICLEWETLRESLSDQYRITTTMNNEDGKAINIRQSSEPTYEQKRIYDALQLSHRPGRRLMTVI
jgi:transposase